MTSNAPEGNVAAPETEIEAIAAVVEHAIESVTCAAVFVPTKSGTTARMISRFNPAVWNIALSREDAVCQDLAFSYGVYPVQLDEDPENWREPELTPEQLEERRQWIDEMNGIAEEALVDLEAEKWKGPEADEEERHPLVEECADQIPDIHQAPNF